MKISKKKAIKLKKKERERRGSKYNDILETLKNLKDDEALIITPDEGMTVQSLKTRVWSAMNRAGMLESPRYYATRTTEKGDLAIMVKMKG